MKLAILPARGGSKRIPRKNIAPFCGRPMLAWSIAAALDSQSFDRILVSTDDEEIAEVARSAGAEVPFIRPANLADDHTGTGPVVVHALEWQLAQGATVEQVCCIYATAPFLQGTDLQLGLAQLKALDADFVFSVTSYAFPIQRAVRITPEQGVQMFQPEHFLTRSQDLEPAWHDAGQFYWGKSSAWLANKPFFEQKVSPYVLPRYRVQDIDTPEDWERAEWMFKAQRQAKSSDSLALSSR